MVNIGPSTVDRDRNVGCSFKIGIGYVNESRTRPIPILEMRRNDGPTPPEPLGSTVPGI